MKTKLSIGILISGKEKQAIRCLESLDKLKRAVRCELILLDTGCSPTLRKRLEEYGDRVESFVWCNDFAKARNELLRYSTGEWFLYLDDDEWFTEVEDLIQFFVTGEEKGYNSATYLVRNFQDWDGIYYSDSRVSRMVRREDKTQFVGTLHEYLQPYRGKTKNLQTVACHDGYVFDTEEEREAHFQRNAGLLAELIEKHPKQLRWQMEFILEYRAIGHWKELAEGCEQFLERYEYHKESQDELGALYVAITEGWLQVGDYAKAASWIERAKEDARLTKLCKIALCLQEALLALRQGRLLEAKKALQLYLEGKSYFEAHPKELEEQRNGALVDETLDASTLCKAAAIRACIQLREKDEEGFWKDYPALGWGQKVIYVLEDLEAELLCQLGTLAPTHELLHALELGWKDQEKRQKTQALLEESKRIEEAKTSIECFAKRYYQKKALQQMQELLPAYIAWAQKGEGMKCESKQPPVLSIGLLASDRKDTIAACLQSLSPIREAIPCELIIVDTGCSPQVRQILEEYGDRVEEFVWCNDFAKARNELLRYATGEWFLYLDDDEWFADVTELIDFFVSGTYKDYGYAAYVQRNYLIRDKSQYTDSWVSRISKRTEDLHFRSKIHEYMEPMSGNCYALHSYVEHFGYIYDTQEELLAHYERNRVLLLDMIKEEPEQLRWWMQLAQEYRSVDAYDQLYDLCQEGLQRFKKRTGIYDNIARSAFYAGKILAYEGWGKHEQAFNICKKAERDKNKNELLSAFAACRRAINAYKLGWKKEAREASEEYFKWKAFFDENEPLFFLQQHAPFVADTFDGTIQKEIYAQLICMGLRDGDTGPLQSYLQELHWEEAHLYVHPDIAGALIDAMNFMPLEERAFDAVIHQMYNNGALWDYIVEQIDKKERGGMNVHTVVTRLRTVLKLEAPKESKEASGVNAELQELAKKVAVQLQILLESQRVDEARKILTDIKKMGVWSSEFEKIENTLNNWKK